MKESIISCRTCSEATVRRIAWVSKENEHTNPRAFCNGMETRRVIGECQHQKHKGSLNVEERSLDIERHLDQGIGELRFDSLEEIHFESLPDIVSSQVLDRVLHNQIVMPSRPGIGGIEAPLHL